MSKKIFCKEFEVRWSDLDSNAHMANTAYLEYAIQTRMAYFAAHGFSPGEFAKRQFGPVIFSEEIFYYKELHMMQKFWGNFLLKGANSDCSRFVIVNELRREDGQLAAKVETKGAWLDLRTRKLMVPPEELQALYRDLPRAEDYADLPEKKGG